MHYQLIPQIRLSAHGAVSRQSGKWQRIHLRQGSVDGACGAYSIMMGLLSLGMLDYAQLTGLEQADGRRREGKLLSKLERFPGLFRQGMDTQEIQNLLRESFGKVLQVESRLGEEAKPWAFIKGHIQNGHPVVLSVRGEGCGHWMVAIGVELDEKREVVRLLALDSSAAASEICPWNAFIEIRRGKNHKYPFNWHSDGLSCFVQLEDAVAIW